LFSGTATGLDGLVISFFSVVFVSIPGTNQMSVISLLRKRLSSSVIFESFEFNNLLQLSTVDFFIALSKFLNFLSILSGSFSRNSF
jgi:hypothetical protein